MKNMLFTIIVVVFIFIASQLAMKNYDLRFLQPNQTSVTIINKEIKPAGTTPIYRYIGTTLYTFPETTQVQPTLYVNIKNKKVAFVVSMPIYQKTEINSTVSVKYYLPKYWGKPFAIVLQ